MIVVCGLILGSCSDCYSVVSLMVLNEVVEFMIYAFKGAVHPHP